MRKFVPLLVFAAGLLPGSALAGIAVVGGEAEATLDAEAQRERDLAALEAIGDLPQASRVLALAAATHPALIEEIAAIHRETSGSFRGLAASLSDARREALWEIVRHPPLLEALAQTRGSRDWPAALADRLVDAPEPLRDLAVALVAETPDVAAEVVALQSLARSRIEEALAPHPLETQATFQALLAQPDVLGLLTEYTELAAALGALHQRDPEAVETLLASVAKLQGGPMRAALVAPAEEVDAVEATPTEVVASADPAAVPLVPVSFVLDTGFEDVWRPRPAAVFGVGRTTLRATRGAPTFRSLSRAGRGRFERSGHAHVHSRRHGGHGRGHVHSRRHGGHGRAWGAFAGRSGSRRAEHWHGRRSSLRAGRGDALRAGSRHHGLRGRRDRR
jgi:hypothetical protein